MVDCHYIKRGNKLYGPYYYRSYRVGKKVKKEYLGKDYPKNIHKKKKIRLLFFVLLIFVILGIIPAMIFSRITGKTILDINEINSQSNEPLQSPAGDLVSEILTSMPSSNPQDDLLNVSHATINATAEEDNESLLTQTNGTDAMSLLNITAQTAGDNATGINETVIQHKAVIGMPVRWTKRITLAFPSNITVGLSKEASNITVKKIADEISGLVLMDPLPITGQVTSEIKLTGRKRNLTFFDLLAILFRNIKARITGHAIEETVEVKTETNGSGKIIEIKENVSGVEVEYYTEAPQAIEQETSAGKIITVSAPDELHYQDVLAYAYFDREAGKNETITLYWINGSEKQKVNFIAYDADNNNLLDYAEWNVPHLSSQTYELSIAEINAQKNQASLGTELVDKRTYNQKVYDAGDGKQRYIIHTAQINYKDEQGNFQEIDATLNFDRSQNIWRQSNASYHSKIPEYADDWFEFYNAYEGANQPIKAKPVASHVKGAYFKESDGSQGVIYKDAFGKGIDLKVYAYWEGLKKVVIINGKPADISKNLTFDFELELPVSNIKNKDKNGKDIVTSDIQVKDKNGNLWDKATTLNFKDKTLKIGDDGKESYFRNAFVWDSGELNQPVDIELYKQGNKIYLRKTITSDILQKAVYPLYTDHPTSYYTGVGDGNLYATGYPSNWDTEHDKTSGGVSYQQTAATCASADGFNGVNPTIHRAFIPIDTSGIADDATISSAILNLYIVANIIYDNDGDDWINVVGPTTQASTTSLTANDFDNCGAVDNPTEGATRIDMGNIVTLAYETWTLSATGIGWIKKTAGDPYTMLGLREGHDCIDSSIAPNTQNNLQFSTSEDTSGTKDPYLDVTATANTAPFIQNISITPAAAHTDSTLNCSANYGDADSDKGNVSITWYNGSVQYSTTTILNVLTGTMVSNATLSGIQALGETWNCTINATDSAGNAGAPNSTTRTIVSNSAPNITSINITPATAYTNSTLNCSANYGDTDGDKGNVSITWYNGSAGTSFWNRITVLDVVNGQLVSLSLNSTIPVKGETWNCTINATDAQGLVGAPNSTTKTISNTNPELTTPSIFPATPNDLDDLNCSFTISDVDMEKMNATIRFYNNSKFVLSKTFLNYANSSVASYNLTSGNLTAGQTWICEGFVYDGTSNSSLMNSSSVTIASSTERAPNVTINFPANASSFSNITVQLNATVHDSDNDNMDVYIYVANDTRYLNTSLVYVNSSVKNNTEILYNLTALPVQPESGVTGTNLIFHFDNRSEFGENDTYVYDFSGNGNNANVTNFTSATCGVNGACPTWNATGGKFGGAFEFDGNGDYIIKANINQRPTNSFTFGGWIKATTTHQIDSESTSSTTGIAGQRYAFGARNAGSNAGTGLSVGTNGISVYEHGSGYMPPLTVYSATIGSGWNHIMVVYNNKQPTIYLNGVAVRTGLTSPKTTVYAPVEIGCGYYGCFPGTIDEVAIWNRSLSATEVAKLYELSAQKYYWKVNASDGSLENTSNTYEFTIYSPLLITVISPINQTYAAGTTQVGFNVSLDQTGSYCQYSLNSAANVSMAKDSNNLNFNATVSSLSSGSYSAQFYCNDTLDNWNNTGTKKWFAIASPANISITETLSPSSTLPSQNVSVSGHINLTNGINVSNGSIGVYINDVRLINRSNGLVVQTNTSWWNESWQYRKQINITNTNKTQYLEKGYSVNLTINTQTLVSQNKLQADCDDLRIAWLNGSSWVELDRVNYTACNTTATDLWFMLQQNLTNASTTNSTTDYWLYYGNTLSISQSNNGSGVYAFYDDFSGSGNDWVGATISSGKLIIGSGANQVARHNISGVSAGSAYIEYLYAFGTGNGETQAGQNYFGKNFLRPHRAQNKLKLNTDTCGTCVDVTWGTTTYKVFLSWSGSGTNEFTFGAGSASTATTLSASGSDVANITFRIDSAAWGPSSIDNIIVRKYMVPEPTTALLSLEESALQTNSSGDYNYTFKAPAVEGNYNITVNLTYGGIYGVNSTTLKVYELPNITLYAPNNESTETSPVNFIFNVTDQSDIVNCSLITGGSTIQQTDTTITKNINQSITQDLSGGTYQWKINCTDTNNNIGSSATRTVTVSAGAGEAPDIIFVSPTPDNGIRQIRNWIYVNVTVNTTTNNIDTCLLEWNSGGGPVNETMNKIGTGTNITCWANKTTVDGTTYTYKVYANDSTNTFGNLFSRSNVENSIPSAVDLVYPATGASTTNRTPQFNWSQATDAEESTFYYQVNITCYPSCPADNRLFNTSESLGLNNWTTITSRLKYFWDDQYYYNWTVRAWDGYEFGVWNSTPSTLKLSSLVSLSLPVSSINFTAPLGIGDVVNTSTGNPAPLKIRNDGNCFININMTNSTALLWETQQSSSSYYKYKIDNSSGEEGSFNWTGSITSWTNVPVANNTPITYFNYTDASDEAEIDILVTVPSAEPPGQKLSELAFTGWYVREF